MIGSSLIAFAIIGSSILARAAPPLASRASVTALTTAQISTFKPYTYYASTAWCSTAATLAWNCGVQCAANPTFKPVASGGDGSSIQKWFVGYDPTLKTVIVSYQGTDSSHILPVVTDLDFFLDELDATLFPGISTDIKVHNGFGEAQAKSATAVLAAVKTTMSKYAVTKVTITGHSLGAAIATITGVYLPLHLPTTTTFKTIVYGLPRTGNPAFANYVDAHQDFTHINNKRDPVPIVPGRFMGFAHPNGEKHIIDSGAWMNCPGHDNTDANCEIGYVPNILESTPIDHAGPFDGVLIDTDCSP